VLTQSIRGGATSQLDSRYSVYGERRSAKYLVRGVSLPFSSIQSGVTRGTTKRVGERATENGSAVCKRDEKKKSGTDEEHA